MNRRAWQSFRTTQWRLVVAVLCFCLLAVGWVSDSRRRHEAHTLFRWETLMASYRSEIESVRTLSSLTASHITSELYRLHLYHTTPDGTQRQAAQRRHYIEDTIRQKLTHMLSRFPNESRMTVFQYDKTQIVDVGAVDDDDDRPLTFRSLALESLFLVIRDEGVWLRLIMPVKARQLAVGAVVVTLPVRPIGRESLTISPYTATATAVSLKDIWQAVTRRQTAWFGIMFQISVAIPGGGGLMTASHETVNRELVFLLVGACLNALVMAVVFVKVLSASHGLTDEQDTLTETIIDHIPGMQIFVKDMDGHYLSCNQAFCEAVGRSREEVLHTGPFYLKREDESVKKGKTERIETMENTRVYVTEKVPLYDHHGTVFGILFLKRDITDYKLEAEQHRMVATQALDLLLSGVQTA